ncbi:hypothetical protein P691DRAFT_788591 [Macrolepiota fuliginosa MF-IS2]|uniref:Uncharacterized protein n=1 Tax=Macrolepiota fuliginosa MF-IS2 TaxID=1400762 RepID=A0A9P6BZ22_9AGAR|nr:hypothetical protein P691DRAFT_788591 [Macrolepiota fuliginosa MF-IS2]
MFVAAAPAAVAGEDVVQRVLDVAAESQTPLPLPSITTSTTIDDTPRSFSLTTYILNLLFGTEKRHIITDREFVRPHRQTHSISARKYPVQGAEAEATWKRAIPFSIPAYDHGRFLTPV